MYQNIILIGNVGKDMEVRTFDNGGKLGGFSLATTKSYKKEGQTEWTNTTSWHNIVVRGAMTSLVIKKGSSVLVEGEIGYREYEQEGVKKYVTEINASRIKVIKKAESQLVNEFSSPDFGAKESDELPF